MNATGSQRAIEPLQRWAMKAGVYVAFLATKQPARIRQVLLRVMTLAHGDPDAWQHRSAAELKLRVCPCW